MSKKTRKTSLSAGINSSILPCTSRSLFGVDRKAPKGFRPIPLIQAMMEFAGPLMEYVDDGTLKEPNEALQIGTQIWNFRLPKVPASQKKVRVEIVTQIHSTLPLDMQEAEECFERMLERTS